MGAPHILLVDDQKEVTRVLRSGLESLEHEFRITDVPSGEEAFLEIQPGSVDLLVSDVRLPGISGLDLMRRVKEANPNLKVILVSGVTEEKIRQEVAQAGADAFFFKPVELPDFLDAVERTLGLVEAMLPSEMDAERSAVAKAKTEGASLAERIADLRNQVKADCVLLFSESGQVLMSAGDIPSFEKDLMPHLLAATGSSIRISKLLQASTPDNLLSFSGGQLNLYLKPIGDMYGLVIAVQAQNAAGIAPIENATNETVSVLARMLESLGVPVKSSTYPPPQSRELSTGELDSELVEAIEKENKQRMDKVEVDAFWAALSTQSSSVGFDSGALSYDQALQLGLAPADEEG
ncbi:MAG: response regulator [Chloroflexi bacterium]|nr:MAG: response regulator [Chloroflexota bacterium]MBL1193071.1 response regulator [Chloroflexota bacterium]NOH10364.1 response regulator [Chloroflexota bacterium]